MAEFPALPLFTDAYLADTRHLTTIQHGAYLLMLMTAWRSGGCCLLDDDNYLARITGMDKRTWLANKSILMSFWHLNEEQKWQQGRLLDERNYVEQLRNKNAAAGRASALKRLNRGSTTVQPNVNQNSTPTPTPTPTPIQESKTPLPPVNGGGGFEKGFRNGRGRKQSYSIRESFQQAVEHIEARQQERSNEGGTNDIKLLP